MKKLYKLFLAVALMAIACNDNTKATGQESATGDTSQVITAPVTDTSFSGCYSMLAGRDTASLQLQHNGTLVTGSLSYNLYQKDRNDGSFQGEASNGLITGWYLFRSEGIMSVRQEIFKIGKDALWPATGEIIMRGDTALFAYPDKLSFDSTRAFLRVKCII